MSIKPSFVNLYLNFQDWVVWKNFPWSQNPPDIFLSVNVYGTIEIKQKDLIRTSDARSQEESLFGGQGRIEVEAGMKKLFPRQLKLELY